MTLCLASIFQNGVNVSESAFANFSLYFAFLIPFNCKKFNANDFSFNLSVYFSSITAKFGYLPNTLMILSSGILTLKLSTTLPLVFESRFRRYAEVEHDLRFPRYHVKNRTKIGLNTFLALLHDRLTPTLIRRVVDSFNVNIPLDRIIRVLGRYPNLAVIEEK
jgi:hypothetical protein